MGVQLVKWQRAVEQHWPNLRFGELKVATDGGNHVFEVQVYLGGLDPDTMRVELYADGVSGGEPVRQEMKLKQEPADASGSYVYHAAVSATRPTADYTARAVPHRDGVAIPLEDSRILWQR
jgi:starch phosphorylase